MEFIKEQILFTFLFFFFIVSLQSQEKKIDSLKRELQIHQEKDTTRVKFLNQLALYHYRNDPPQAIAYVVESLKLAKELKFIKFIARCSYVKGVVYMEQANFEVAIDNLNNAIKHYTTINDLNGIEKCKNALGVLYDYKGEYKLSLKNYEEGKAIAEKLGNKESINTYLYNMGNIYASIGDYQKAKNNFNKVLNINIKDKDSLGMLSCLNSIATVYYEQSNYSQSLKYNNESLYIAQKIKDSIGIFQSYINIGNTYRLKDLYDKALHFYNKALAIKAASFNVKNITALKNNIAGVFYDKKNYESAEAYYLESIALSQEIDDNVNLVTAINGLGFNYLKTKKHAKALKCFKEALEIYALDYTSLDLLDSYQGLAETYFDMKKYDLALLNARELEKLAEKNKVLLHKKEAYIMLYKIYKIKGDYKKALENHEQYKIIGDSLLNKENIKKITEIEYEYKYKNELENAEKREIKLTKTVKATSKDLEKSQQKLLLGVIVFLIITILLAVIIFFLKLRNIRSKNQNSLIEQKLLRSQMTPHFIFNSLSVLQGIILNKEEEKSIHYLSKFSKLLRITLENSRDTMVLLSQELIAIENYLALQNLENESYRYSILVDKTIAVALFKIPPMLIQPFIENAIEHGFKNQNENKKIDVQLKFSGKSLICIITDNGIGINAQKESVRPYKKSLATTITSERLEILSKEFKMKGSVTVEDRQQYNEKGTIVTLVIPYKIYVA
ncbi:tetratricopeptide repeat protein [Flavobacterium jejuense]|uniref:Tetratricopeptide repeat protein n=1 Tax=Flavobacterium jejuense TaxID=1544455 RepID=A0ABX0IQ35_9FLAO|nr:tetratricopeptide repeat protein [Flavobacterium jejuense]NHN25306.1 tetratricopeptide repeat protein [Flavobacterium jejuense]